MTSEYSFEALCLWRELKATLESMLVSRIGRSIVDEMRRVKRMFVETENDFLTRMHLWFPTKGKPEGECEHASIRWLRSGRTKQLIYMTLYSIPRV